MPSSARPFFITLAAAASLAGQVRAETAEAEVEAVVVTGSRLANASINGLEIETLRLPQNVRVLDEDLIRASGIANLSDLFDYAGGMARQNSFGGAWDAYAIRGFSGDINQGPDLLVNRFTANRGFNPRRDVASIEVFQVLKGPASALSGKGEPGGSINIVTKAPRDVMHAALEAGYGSHDTRRGVVDLGGPLGTDLGVRLVGAYQATDGFRDFVGSERLFLAPSLAWRPTESLSLLYQLEYADVDFVHDRGLVAINGDGKALPRDRFLGEPNDGRIKQRTWQHQGSLTWELADNIALEAGVQYRDGDFVGQSTHNSVLVGTQLRRQLRVHDYFWDDLSGRAELSGRFAAGETEHQIRVGADAFTFDQRRIFFRFNPTAANPYAIDVLRPVYGQPKPTAPLNQDILEDLRGESIYVQDLITLGSEFSILVGLRHDWIRQTNTNFRNGAVTRQSPSETSPRAAFTWSPSETFSAYASWGRSFRYNQGADAAGGAFPAERGEALEAGVKYALMDGRLTGTASVFRIEKENVLVNDPANPGFSTPAGEARSQGFEADLNLAIDRNLTLTAVYALTDSEITKDTRAFLAGSGLSNVPKHSAAMFGTWRSGQEGAGEITVSGGLVYVGERPGDDVASGFELPDYVTARVNLGYQVTERLSAHLDIENLFDTYYLESSFSNVWIAPGAARTVTARLRWSY